MRLGHVVFGQYEIVDFLPSGGEADIAKARETGSGQFVVLKRLSASPDEPEYAARRARFERAGQICIGQPNVVDAIASGEEDGELYIVFPYVDGETLDIYVSRHGGLLPTEAAVVIVRGVAAGLAAAHRQGIVHRDIKPQNILVLPDGQPRLIDFGILRRMDDQTVIHRDGLLGTLKWMSPEQIRDPASVDHRSDLYALGVVFYNLLTGTMPIQGADASAIALSICDYHPPSPRMVQPSIPAHIDHACMRLLVKDRNGRMQSAEEFLQALNPAGPAVPPRTCASCGNSLEAGFAFCPRCGAAANARKRRAQCLACGADVRDPSVCPNCRRTFSPTCHKLVFGAGSVSGAEFWIPEGIYVVGRDALSPRDAHISRHHVAVACLNGSLHVQDAGSANKTYVDGQLAEQPTAVSSGTEIRIAGNTAIYTCN